VNGAACGAQRRWIPPSTLVRWCKFNFVGGIGIVVQFGALFLLKSVLHFEYLAATAIAVEAAVLHNFIWHEQFTWADRTQISSAPQQTSGAEALDLLSEIVAALKRCATQKPAAEGPGTRRPAAQGLCRASSRRLVRFHLSNGGVSIVGNLALMKIMVGLGGMNYLVANAIAITVCSVANFLMSEMWVFERE